MTTLTTVVALYLTGVILAQGLISGFDELRDSATKPSVRWRLATQSWYFVGHVLGRTWGMALHLGETLEVGDDESDEVADSLGDEWDVEVSE